jgi:hypothetical protein
MEQNESKEERKWKKNNGGRMEIGVRIRGF